MNTELAKALRAIVGNDGVTTDADVLAGYTPSESIFTTCAPMCVVWPRSASEVQKIIELANKKSFTIVPVSSSYLRLRDESLPKRENSIIVDLSRMKKIVRVDTRNKVTMVEAGVTFKDLLPELKKAGLRPLMPFLPRATKSVLTACLDREPITTPRFHWDASDPLLCTETIFGTGDLFRTGSAAGPGTLEEQWESGQAQKNPQGPSQFDPFRIIQGSQGTIGIVTWASIKCELLPEEYKILVAGSDDIDDFLDFSFKILRRRLVDEHFILNAMGLAAALRKSPEQIIKLRDRLPSWNLIVVVSGHGVLAKDELEYRMADTLDIASETGVTLSEGADQVKASEIQNILHNPSDEPYWKLKLKGGFREVFFTTTLDRASSLFESFKEVAGASKYPTEEITAYIQPIVQGTSTHCGFDVYFDPSDTGDVKRTNTVYIEGSRRLLDEGAFFSRPLGPITDEVFSRASPEIVQAMRSVKTIFDPNGVLNPGTLCFKEVPK